MASMRSGVCDVHNTNSEYVLEDELFNVSTNTIEHEFDEIAEESVERLERKPSKTEADLVTIHNEGEGNGEIGVRQCFVDFCRQTILHGWHYLVDYEDSSDSQEEFSDIACPSRASPKENSFKPRGYHPSQSSTHKVRNRHPRHSTNRTRNSTRNTYHARQHSQHFVPKDKPEVFGDHVASTKYEERGKY